LREWEDRPVGPIYRPMTFIDDRLFLGVGTRLATLFPPMPVYILYAPGPGLPYDAQKLPPPEYQK